MSSTQQLLRQILTELTEINRPFRSDSFILRYLRYVSGPPGAKPIDLNVNASLENPSVFEFTVPIQMCFKLAQIHFFLMDGVFMRYGEFGDLRTPLTHGIQIQALHSDGTVAMDFTNGEGIKTNEDFFSLAGENTIIQSIIGVDFLPITWSVQRVGAPMLMHGGEKIRLLIQDDLSDITKFRAMIHGLSWCGA